MSDAMPDVTKDLAVTIAFTKRSEANKARSRFPQIDASVVPVTGSLSGGRYYVVVAKDKTNQQAWFKAHHEKHPGE